MTQNCRYLILKHTQRITKVSHSQNTKYFSHYTITRNGASMRKKINTNSVKNTINEQMRECKAIGARELF